MADREQLQQKVAQMEAVNERLVNMLWGRRSELRPPSPDQLLLDFPDDVPLTEEEQGVIQAQQQAEEARDEELVRAMWLVSKSQHDQ